MVSKEAAVNTGVGINTPVAEERPVAADLFEMMKIDFGDQNFLFLCRCLRKDDTLWIGDEGCPPKLDSRRVLERPLESDTVDRSDIDAVGNGVTALHRLPGIALSFPVLCFLMRVPTDGRRVKENRRALE